MKILRNILKFITDPKNTRMLLLAGVVVLILLLLQQCNAKNAARDEAEKQKQETQRITNNYRAAEDSIEQYQIDKDTWEAEKKGYLLDYDELKSDYSNLLADFKEEKNKPPKVVIRTEYIIKDSIRDVPVLVEIDSLGNKTMKFGDSINHDKSNFMVFDGKIPYEITFDEIDSVYRLVPGSASLDFELGMNLDLGLFQDEDTKEVFIKAQTNYPGLKFTTLDGALVRTSDENKKALRALRKPWALGLNLGYGAVVDVGTGTVSTGPYFGVGISYSPKFLQWGR